MNYTQVQRRIRTAVRPASRCRLQAEAGLLAGLVDQAIALGLRPEIARRRGTTYLQRFIADRGRARRVA